MSKIISLVILFLVLLSQFPQIAHAASINPATIGELKVGETKQVVVSGLEPGKRYFWSETGPSGFSPFPQCINADGNGELEEQTLGPFPIAGSYNLLVKKATSNLFSSCIGDASAPFDISQNFTVTPHADCSMRTEPTALYNTTLPSAKFFVNVDNNQAFPRWKMQFECGVSQNVDFAQLVTGSSLEIYRERPNSSVDKVLYQPCEFHAGDHSIKVIAVSDQGEGNYCTARYTIIDNSTVNGTCRWNLLTKQVAEQNCTNGTVPTVFSSNYSVCTCMPPGSGDQTSSPPPKTCKDRNDPTFDPNLNIVCVTSGGSQCSADGSPGFNTAIGCIPTNPEKLVPAVLRFVIGISGGLAFLLMLLGAFQMLSSAGNPETLNAGKDRFTQAIIGLLFVIFSVLLLQIIGVDILRLEQFGR